MSGPIEALAHDHRELNGLLLAVNDALARVERGASQLADEIHEIRDGIEGFREALLEHFAREQEGLLPFVLARLPDVDQKVDDLIAEHDRIAALLTVLAREVNEIEPGADLRAFRASLERFESLYASHSRTELGFLSDVAAALAGDTLATTRLRELLGER